MVSQSTSSILLSVLSASISGLPCPCSIPSTSVNLRWPRVCYPGLASHLSEGFSDGDQPYLYSCLDSPSVSGMYARRVGPVYFLASSSFLQPSCLGLLHSMSMPANVRHRHHLSQLSWVPTESCNNVVHGNGSLNIPDWCSTHPWTEVDLEAKQLFPKIIYFGSNGSGEETWLHFRYSSKPKRKAKTYKESLVKCQAIKQSRLDADSFGNSQIQDGLYQSTNAPFGGDLTEIENFCRIYRLAEELHTVVMSALHNLNTIQQTKMQASEGGNVCSGDKDLANHVHELEEKVVASLACIGASLQEERSQLFANNGNGLVSVQKSQLRYEDNKHSSLASFRVKMINCCNLLRVRLESLLPSCAGNNIFIYQSLQRLVNVCLDVGFPRPKGTPSHADIPNLEAVRWQSHVAGEDEDVAFWTGGQITEEGLQWLIDSGFKMLVDLRAEQAENSLTVLALKNAVGLGKIRHVTIPVPSEIAPSMDQVKEFARLLADPENRPLFLQSREGLGRTSAIVSRWREISASGNFKVKPEKSAKRNSLLPIEKKQTVSLPYDENKTGIAGIRFCFAKEPSLHDYVEESTSHIHTSPSETISRNIVPSVQCSHLKVNVDKDIDSTGTLLERHNSRNKVEDPIPTDKLVMSNDFGKKDEACDLNARVLESSVVRSPFEAQRPGVEVLSRKQLRRYSEQIAVPNNFDTVSLMKGKNVHAPATTGEASFLKFADTPKVPSCGDLAVIDHTTVQSRYEESEYKGVSTECLEAPVNSEQKFADIDKDDGNIMSERNNACNQEHIQLREDEQDVPDSGCQLKTVQAFKYNQNATQTGHTRDLYDEEEPSPEGDMCASKTGVVRLQSRKKAEMYLVRTDGVSCTREKVEDSTLAFTHPSTQQQMLMWKTLPRTVLLLKKLGDELMDEAEQVASFLYYDEEMNVMVEPEVHDRLARRPGFEFVQTFYNQDTSNLHESVDFVVCLGGDGVILHASDLFRTAVPPVVSFNLGSLGFLTAHPFEDFKQDLRAIIHGNTRCEGVYLTLRMRLLCELLRNGNSVQGKVFEALNEVVVDRGSSPYLSKIECYERNRLITKVQGDGVIVATPTGSTAYSTAAGGSMVHPNVPCILFTPICPHSLSFRPVIFPDSAVLELKVPDNARSNAWVSFDGKKRQQLFRGDSVRVRMSRHPLPTVNKSDQTDDWFRSLIHCLNWNGRLEQRALSE
ncbi:hypothetical protein O6H91_23G058800 [Diphasiastrum complanatum]|uniref:Uncharacterized protein n=2 Tax=Diphasiastrum complanatum TaxID=34168 RepID=A0ACC2AB94_DIPCM|nr:hypothetical protein O6H91_23G058800 [Diphasiastrum complanatum]